MHAVKHGDASTPHSGRAEDGAHIQRTMTPRVGSGDSTYHWVVSWEVSARDPVHLRARRDFAGATGIPYGLARLGYDPT